MRLVLGVGREGDTLLERLVGFGLEDLVGEASEGGTYERSNDEKPKV